MTDTISVNVSPQVISVEVYDSHAVGPRGYSAYQVAVNNGYVGTEAQWLASLQGTDGKSAYQVAVDNGFVGTEAEWLESLHYNPGYTPEDSANKETSVSESNTKYPTSLAVSTLVSNTASSTLSSANSYAAGVANTAESNAKAYADSVVASVLKLKGNYDASGNAWPSTAGIKAGWFWYISVAGTLKGKAVTAGDSIYAVIDNPGQTDANWEVLETNIGFVPEQAGVAASLIAAHSVATDPHGDRAYAASIVSKAQKNTFFDDFFDYNDSNSKSPYPRLTALTNAEMTTANLNWNGGARILAVGPGGYYRTHMLGKVSNAQFSMQPSRGTIEVCTSVYLNLLNTASAAYFGVFKDAVENLGNPAKIATLEASPTDSPNWRLRNVNGTFVDTGVVASLKTEFKLKLRITTGLITAYINGVSVATSAVASDDTIAHIAGFGLQHGGASTNDADIWADYLGQQQTLTTARSNFAFD